MAVFLVFYILFSTLLTNIGMYCAPVEALAVADGGVLPGEGQQDSLELLQGGAGG